MEPIETELTLQHCFTVISIFLVAVTEPIEKIVVVNITFILIVLLRAEGAWSHEFRVPAIAAHASLPMKKEEVMSLMTVQTAAQT